MAAVSFSFVLQVLQRKAQEHKRQLNLKLDKLRLWNGRGSGFYCVTAELNIVDTGWSRIH